MIEGELTVRERREQESAAGTGVSILLKINIEIFSNTKKH